LLDEVEGGRGRRRGTGKRKRKKTAAHLENPRLFHRKQHRLERAGTEKRRSGKEREKQKQHGRGEE
jgi:hypothetical protein